MVDEQMDARLRDLSEALDALLIEDFDALGELGRRGDDALGEIEDTVQLLALDIKTMVLANRETEASLLIQQQALATRRAELDAQREQIQAQARELEARARTIAAQAEAIRELSTPVLEVWPRVLVLPIIGIIDSGRVNDIMSTVLDAIERRATRFVILDVTGVNFVDTHTVDQLSNVVGAARLLGASCVLSGVQPAVARALVMVGASFGDIEARRNLEQALLYCLERLSPIAGASR